MFSCLLPVSMTDVGATFEPTLDDGLPPPPLAGPELLLLLFDEVLVLVPNTESEFTTIVSVKFDVVNLAIASFERRSLLLPE